MFVSSINSLVMWFTSVVIVVGIVVVVVGVVVVVVGAAATTTIPSFLVLRPRRFATP